MDNRKPHVKISLCSAEDKTELPSTRVGDKVYFHAEPNTSFTVKFTIECPGGTIFPQYENLLVYLYIDGQDIGYSKRVTRTLRSGVFEGFYKSVDNTK